MPRALMAMLLCLLASCATYKVDISTASDIEVTPGPRDSVSDVTVIDARPSGSSNIASTIPVPELVAASMRAGLARRLMLAPDGPYHIELTLARFEAAHGFGATAGVAMSMAVLDRGNRVVYRSAAGDAASSGTAGNTAGNLLFLVFAGNNGGVQQYNRNRNAEVGDALQHAMVSVTDRLLDNVYFRNAVGGIPPA